MEQLDTHETITYQDYGLWLGRLVLYKNGETLYLLEEFGYGKPYDRQWYRLSARPAKTLKEAFKEYTNGLCCGATGSKDSFEMELEVQLTQVARPN